MKNFLKKINRGILLSAVMLLGVIIYLISLSVVQAREKPLLEELCRQYVATEIAYSVLPEQYRDKDTVMADDELDAYLAQMKAAISPFYFDNEQILQLAVDRIGGNLATQAEGWYRIREYEKSIQFFDSFEFDGSKVTVRFKSLTTIERVNSEMSAQPETRQVGETDDLIILQKAEGSWYIVYAALNEPARYR